MSTFRTQRTVTYVPPRRMRDGSQVDFAPRVEGGVRWGRVAAASAGALCATVTGLAVLGATVGRAAELQRPLSAQADRVLPPQPQGGPLVIPAQPAPSCQEDQPCWRPGTMGNGLGATPKLDQGGVPILPSGAPVVVEDEQSQAVSDFPIAAAVAAWHLPNVTLGVCDETRARCVRVVEVDSLPTQQAGITHTGETVESSPGVARVELSQQTPVTLRLEDTVHELGHALGLAHRKGTVMEPILSGRYTQPTAAQHALAARNIG